MVAFGMFVAAILRRINDFEWMTHGTETVRVHLSHAPDRSHDVVLGTLSHLAEALDERGIDVQSCLVVTDENVARLHADALRSALGAREHTLRLLVVAPGERSKSMASYASLVDSALSSPLHRRTLVVAFGGGVVGDVGGFLAATLLRGLPLLQVPTSLVAQVDSSVGGKTGINHDTGKNLVGSFYQPRLVWVDTGLLDTLPESEWIDGLSEVVKYGLIADAEFTHYLIENWERVMTRDHDVVRFIVRRCLEIKAHVVSNDETEQGLRAILNFGHTFGHALERVAGYQGITHGQAVAVGMRAALHVSERRLPEMDFLAARTLLDLLPHREVISSIDDLIDSMATDKKRTESGLRFVLLKAVGEAEVETDVATSDVRLAWQHALQHAGQSRTGLSAATDLSV